MDLVSEGFAPRQLSPELVVRAYQEGFFPMACADGLLRWFSPDPRGILPLDSFHLPHGYRRVRRRLGFELRLNTAFARVVRQCGERETSWIDASIRSAYETLHHQGLAHSVETWHRGRLVGGLYGVSLGSAFFGESMFSRVSHASKFALEGLVTMLREGGFRLLDCQWTTPHLQGFGAVDIPRPEYLLRLREAVEQRAFLRLPPAAGPSVGQGPGDDFAVGKHRH